MTCPLEVLKQREVERNNRCLGSAEASIEYLFPKEGYNLTIDTFVLTAEECALQIFEIMYS